MLTCVLCSYKYNNSDLLLNRFVNDQQISNSEIIDIKSSNSINPYFAFDNKPQTVWKGKKGDWIELILKEDTNSSYHTDYKIRAINMLNGDYSNKGNFDKLGKIKTLKIFINDTNVYRPVNGEYGDNVNLLKPEYITERNNLIKGYSQTIAEGDALMRFNSDAPKGQKQKKVIRKIKIQIKDIYQGISNTNEFAISEIYILGYK